MTSNKGNTRCPYRIIFSDIDGTLLNSSHQVTEGTRREILRLEQMGVPFVLVSARMREAMVTIRAQIGNHAPMVCYSGGLICDAEDQVLYSCLMDLGQAAAIKEMLERDFPDVCCNTYGYDRWVVDDRSNPWVKREEEITCLCAENGDMRQVFAPSGGIHKFLLMGEPDRILSVEERIKREHPDLSVAASTPCYLEVMNGLVKKSAGLHFLCKTLGVPPEEAIAFGDGCNDIDMLQAAGCGYAMANAPQAVRDSAAHVTLDNDHEGLLAALKANFPEDILPGDLQTYTGGNGGGQSR